MGLGQNLKDFYTSLEDGYYSVLDRIQDHLPVYSFVDPVDRVVPSFALILIMFLGVIGLIAFSAVFTQNPFGSNDQVFVNVVVENRVGDRVPQIPVTLVTNSQERELLTDSSGFIAFLVPKNTAGTLKISIDGFEPVEESILVTDQNIARQLTLVQIPVPIERTIQFADSAGRAITGKRISVKLRCSKDDVSLEKSTYVSDLDGKINVTEPPGCGTLQATLLGPGEFSADPFTVTSAHQIIKLSAVEIPTGDIYVRVTDSQDRRLEDINAIVILFDDSGEVKRAQVQTGIYKFQEIEIGSYYVTVQDQENKFGSKKSDEFAVKKDELTKVNVVLTKSIQQSLTVWVQEKDSTRNLRDAKVILVSKTTKKELFSKNTDEFGKAVFSIQDSEAWIVQASLDGYYGNELNVSATETQANIKLEKITEANSGILIVRVEDEDGKPVENAKVRLRDKETEVFAPYPARTTDINGEARWEGIKEDIEVFGYAEKFPASGSSPAIKIVKIGTNKLTITMEVGDTKLNVSALTEDGEFIPNSIVEIFDATGESLGELPMTSGTASTNLKSDKRIYVIVKNPDFFAYQSETVQLFKDREINIQATLPSRILSGGPKAILMGVFGEGSEAVDKMEAGNNYTVKIQLRIPEDSSYSETGVHFRVGSQSRMENDQIIIKAINVANATISQGTTFNPPRGQVIDLNPANQSFGDSKWANIAFSDTQPGVYNIAIDVRVKNSATLNAPIPMNYRAWAKTSDNRMIRDPADNELGESFQTNSTQGLYANSYPVTRYFEGAGSDCDERLCYSNIRMYDNSQALYLINPFELTINKDYNFVFSITNSSPANLAGGKLIITFLDDGKETENIQVKKYWITNASAQTFNGTSFSDNRLEIDAGSMVVNAGVSGNILFRTEKVFPAAVRLQLVFNGEIISTKEIPFESIADKKILIQLSPDPIPALIEVPAVVSLTEEGNNEPVNDALVTLSRITRDRSKTDYQRSSNGLGNAEFLIPASSPGTRIVVDAEKPNYVADALERIVDDNVLIFDPEELNLALKTNTQREDEIEVTIENRTEVDIRLSKLQLVGNFSGLLDRDRINGYLQTLVGETIPKKGTKKITLLKAFLSPTATVVQNQTLEASLAIEAVDARLNTTWVFSVPARISVSIDGVPENESCLTIDETTWDATSQENNMQFSFTLQNNCKVAGKPLSLGNLASKISWTTDAIGNVELTLTDASNPNNAITVVLREESWVDLFNAVPSDGIYSGTLKFVPKTGKTGKTASFSVDFSGETQTENGLKRLTAKDPINANILITNLSLCVKYESGSSSNRNLAEYPNRSNASDEPETEPMDEEPTDPNTTTTKEKNGLSKLNLAAGNSGDEDFTTVTVGTKDESTLTIDTSECGELPVDIIICKDDDYCRGGTAEGGIDVKPLDFSLSPETPVREITVKRMEIAGIYGLTIWARTQGRAYSKIATIDVEVDPQEDNGEYFSLSKYIFYIKGLGTQDSGILKNKNFVTTTTIDAPASMWNDRAEEQGDGMFDSLLPMLGLSLLPQMLQGIPTDMGAARDAGEELAENWDEAKQDATKAIKDVQDDALEMHDEFADQASPQMDKVFQGAEKLNEAADSSLCDDLAQAFVECGNTGTDPQSQTCKDARLALGQSGVQDKCSGIVQSVRSEMAPFIDPDAMQRNLDDIASNMTAIDNQLGSSLEAVGPLGKYNSPGEISSASNAAASTLSSECGKISGLKGKLDGVKTNVMDLKNRLFEAIGDDKTGLTKIKEKDIKSYTDEMSSVMSGCPTCKTGMDASMKAFNDKISKQVDEQLKTLKDAEQELYNKFDPNASGSLLKGTQEALDDAITKCEAAQKAMADKGNATRQMSDDVARRESGSNPNASAALGNTMNQMLPLAMMSSMMGNGLFGADDPATDDEEGERVQQEQQVFAIDLTNDVEATSMDNEGVKAALSTEDVRTMGNQDIDYQQLPVLFENMGLDAETPVYAVMTVDATEHVFEDVTRVPIGADWFNMFNGWNLGQFFGETQNYEQKFHLKFVSRDTVYDVQPQVSENFACTQGTMVGQSGDEALPRIKLRWNWTDIAIDSCDAKNPEYIYCDATQFSIMMTKRLAALREFLEANPGLPCPVNWMEQQVQAEMDPFNEYLIELNMEVFNTDDHGDGCWLPMNTELYDNKSALEYYVDDAGSTVSWTAQVPNASSLHDLLFFDAYLIQDGFTEDFKKDFATYYSDIAFLDTPTYFHRDASGGNFNQFFETGELSIAQKYTNSMTIPTTGLYRVETIVNFDNEDWAFFDSEGIPAASIDIGLLALRQNSLNSVFYYLPFDGEVGLDGATFNRQGYGIGYEVLNNAPIRISRSQEVSTRLDAGSNPIQQISVSTGGSFDTMNAFASQRGFILDIQNTDESTKSITMTPSLATPVLMKITQPASTESFGAFYTIRNSEVPQNVGSSAAYWSGAGACRDYSGNLVGDAWDYRPDRQGQSGDRLPDWEMAYGVDWPGAETGGDVYLKTVFYSPVNMHYTLHASSSNVSFMTPNQPFGLAIDLQGISTMAFNRQGATDNDRITAIEDLFNLVSQQKVCVTNTGMRTSFWWNPKTIYEQKGSANQSVLDFENGLVSGSTCK